MEIFNSARAHFPKWIENSVYGYELLRSLTFLGQSLTLPMFEFLLTGQTQRPINREAAKRMGVAYKDLIKLLKEDSANIAKGLYPVDVLLPESPKDFLLRYPQIIVDGVKISRRRLSHKAHDFEPEAKQYFPDVPEYFQRNFHYQSGGYLTDKSAELYEHQVEILFAGAADAMRRLLLRPLREHFPYSQGEGLHFLEVAAGTGRLSRFVKLAFPKAKLTILDLSYPYLKKAQENLQGFKKINYVQGDAANLPFKSDQFDAVFSCFLFHELPLDVRRQVLSEGFRVLRPGGFYGLVDSIQNADNKTLTWALDDFPKAFHEPFYKNYQMNPMEGLLQAAELQSVQNHLGFFSKVVHGVKAETEA